MVKKTSYALKPLIHSYCFRPTFAAAFGLSKPISTVFIARNFVQGGILVYLFICLLFISVITQ